MEKSNVGTKGKSLEQGLTSAIRKTTKIIRKKVGKKTPLDDPKNDSKIVS